MDTGLIKPGMLIALALGQVISSPSVANDRAFSPGLVHVRMRRARSLTCERKLALLFAITKNVARSPTYLDSTLN